MKPAPAPRFFLIGWQSHQHASFRSSLVDYGSLLSPAVLLIHAEMTIVSFTGEQKPPYLALHMLSTRQDLPSTVSIVYKKKLPHCKDGNEAHENTNVLTG